MALFKIFKGIAKNLPSTYHDGYCYITTDDHKMYIDTTNTSSGRICLNAAKADVLTTKREINGIEFDGSKNVLSYAVCSTAAATAAKTVSIDGFVLTAGAQIRVYFQNANTAANPTLNVSGTGAKGIYQYGSTAAGTSITTSSWPAGAVVSLTYTGDRWIRDYWYNNTYSIYVPQSQTAAGTAAKNASCSYFTPGKNNYFPCVISYANTAQSALTLNINGSGAKPIYINGSASSASNYTLPAGVYQVYYNGTNYYFRTDTKLQGNLAGTADYASSAGSASKLSTNAGSANTPVYFSNGVPVACTGVVGPTYFRGETVASAAASSIAMPTEITNNMGSNLMLQVYQNGLLLTETTNYSINSAKTAINLADYTCAAGDIFTFTLITRSLTGLDASNYLTKASANASYLPLTGGTMRGSIAMGGNNITGGGTITGNKVYGAVWNDYAEYRIADTVEPGAVVCENGDDTMSVSKERMQPAAAIVSDTFGFAIGETDKAKTPIAVSGRVLAKPHESIEEFRKAIGRPVCAGPEGTVSIMTDEEYATKGYCSIGIVSAVPDYETWGEGIKVNGRVWIKVK